LTLKISPWSYDRMEDLSKLRTEQTLPTQSDYPPNQGRGHPIAAVVPSLLRVEVSRNPGREGGGWGAEIREQGEGPRSVQGSVLKYRGDAF